MTLIQVGKDTQTYLNMDFIQTTYKHGDSYYVRVFNGTQFSISEETFNIILDYGKATKI